MSANNPVPPEVRGWNWGAFLLTWIWGLGNKCWISLLCFIPFVGFIMVFVLGAKGNEWAWKAGNYTDVNKFHSIQKIWAMVGTALFGLAIAGGVGMVMLVFSLIKGSEPYQIAIHKVQESAKAQEVLGTPIKDEWYCGGSINEENGNSSCELEIPVKGPKGAATLSVEGAKHGSEPWQFKEMVLESGDTRIDLNQ